MALTDEARRQNRKKIDEKKVVFYAPPEVNKSIELQIEKHSKIKERKITRTEIILYALNFYFKHS